MNGLPKRGDFQLAYEARRVEEHFRSVSDHSKCSLAQPCQSPHVKKVENPLQRHR